MSNPTLGEDILYAIACTQDYRDTIDTGNEHGEKLWDNVSERIERLFQFYYQLVGFDPNNIRTIKLDEID
ncbi:hypothetical protein EBQ81_00990 [bacterium]|nr:hypothetical protein [bacterium]